MSKKWKSYLGIMVLICGMILLFKDIFDLWNTKDLHTVKADYAIEVLEVTHHVYVIPVRKDHYYLTLQENEEGIVGYIVLAGGKWLEKNFDANNYTTTEGGVEVVGLSKELKNKYQSKIQAQTKTIEDALGVPIQFVYQEDHYLDTGYRWKAILKLVTLIFILLEILAGVIFAKKSVQSRPILTTYLIIVILTLFMFLACLYISM